MNLTYNYDATGNILHMKNEDSSSIREEWNYTYDPLDRLLFAAGGPPGENYSLDYQYDSTGNRTQLNSTTYTYNEMNELLSLSDSGGSSVFTYDIYGNLVTEDDGQNLWEYSYDCENRLLSVKKDGQVVEEYFYDGDGKRIKKTDADSERVYIYGGLNALHEVNITTQMEAVYLHGPTGQLAKKVNDITEYYHTDHLGSTRLVTSENGVTTEEITYKPFGEQLNETEERYTYNGKELDETGLYFYGARYYDPVIGRFLTRDTVWGEKESPQTLNKYIYCLNNPLTYTDPTGNDPEEENAQDVVEQIFQRLLGVNPEDIARIQEELDSGKITALDALVEIIGLLGYYVRPDTIDIENKSFDIVVEEGKLVTMKIDDTLENWGEYDVLTGTASINFSKSGNVADMTVIALHEISHAVLTRKFPGIDTKEQEPIIYSVQYFYAGAVWQSGIKCSREYMDHLRIQEELYDPNRTYRCPISEAMERWIYKTGW